MSGYALPVRNILARLVLVLAVLLMPLGMTPAAASGPAHHSSASMPMGHCDQEAPRQHGDKGISECMMACSVALPAAAPARDAPAVIVCLPAEPAAAEILRGLEPDPATPPPKRS